MCVDKNGVRELLAPLGTKMLHTFISHGQGLAGGRGAHGSEKSEMLAAALGPGRELTP